MALVVVRQLFLGKIVRCSFEGGDKKVLNQIEYYRDAFVGNRFLEFINKAEYIVGYGEAEIQNKNPKAYYSAPLTHLWAMMERGLDIFSSILGYDGTLVSLDIDYYNSKSPGEIYFDSDNVFKNKIEPIREIVKSVYRDFGISYLEVITGCGYHYHSLWPFNNEHWQLEKIGCLEYTLEQQYIDRRSQDGRNPIPVYKGFGHSGAFRLLQFISLEIMERASCLREKNKKIIQIEFCDIEVPSPGCVSIDLTTYSDPLYMRVLRVPFSTHQKHKVKKHEIGEDISNLVPIQTILPTSDMSIDNLLKMRRNFRWSSDYARDPKSSCIIPNSSKGWLNVLSKYKNSELHQFHTKFDSIDYEKENDWSTTYYALNLNELLPCVKHSIVIPEPHIKKPTNIRKIVAVLRSKGWDYKHIAGFFYSHFKKLIDFSSNKYNAEIRANFFVQLYGAPIYLGIDKLLDINCISHSEIGYCIKSLCGHDLALWKPNDCKD
ncbi:MAG: hypothetical protein ABID79_01665 [Elusimicrobiota bacterium]